jgi:hypothetical protein
VRTDYKYERVEFWTIIAGVVVTVAGVKALAVYFIGG